MNLLALRLLRKLGILQYINTSGKVTLNNHVFNIPILKELGMHNLMMDEYWMLDIIKRLSPNDDDVFLDMGANVGQSLLKWKSVNLKAPVYSIEPNPACNTYLEALIKRNELETCLLVQKALGEEKSRSKLNFHFKEESDRSASTVEGLLKIHHSIEVETIDFNSLLESEQIVKSNIKLIKIDIEGSEYDVLQSMRSFLLSHHPPILVEILSSSAQYTNDISDLLNDLDLNIYRIKKRGFYLNGFEKIDTIGYPVEIIDSDYLLMHSELENATILR